MGAAGRCGAWRRVGAGHAGPGEGEPRVQPAEAEGYDRHRGSQRGAQSATLPGLHREAGVPQGAHSDLVRAPVRELFSIS